MIFCPRCGSPASPPAAHCGVCGAALGPVKEEPAQRVEPPSGSMKRTMVGVAPGHQTSPAGPSGPSNPLKGTMIGVAPYTPAGPVPGAAPAANAASTQPFKGTMMGVSPNFVASPTPAATPQALKGTMIGLPPTGAQPPPPGPNASPASAPFGGKQTMVGVAAPVMTAAPAAAPATGARVVEHKRTMMGVAMPGIAPLAPGVPKEPVAAPMPPMEPAPGYAPFEPAQHAAYQPPPDPHRQRSARPPARPRPQTSAAVALVAGLFLAAGAAAFAFFWRSPAPLRAEARVDSAGADQLHVTCGNCPDGTELSIANAKASVTGHVADLALGTPLAVGENVFLVNIDRPSSGRDEKVSLTVRIGYRIRPDLSALDSDHPALRILVEGAPLAKMTIDGKSIVLGADGKGQYDVDITPDCSGLADDAKIVERSIPYSVTGPSGVAEPGAVNLRVTVTPLHVDLPSAHGVVETDRFLFAGRTSKGGHLTAGTESVPVAADGGFAATLRADTVGDNPMALRASAAGQAPRIATVTIKRVTKLADEARNFAASAPLPFQDLTADVSKHVGEPIVLAGDVVDARQQGSRTLALLDVQKGCPRPPCAARVWLAGADAVARGAHVQVFGHVSRAVSAKAGDTGTVVPEVESDFFLKRR